MPETGARYRRLSSQSWQKTAINGFLTRHQHPKDEIAYRFSKVNRDGCHSLPNEVSHACQRRNGGGFDVGSSFFRGYFVSGCAEGVFHCRSSFFVSGVRSWKPIPSGTACPLGDSFRLEFQRGRSDSSALERVVARESCLSWFDKVC